MTTRRRTRVRLRDPAEDDEDGNRSSEAEEVNGGSGKSKMVGASNFLLAKEDGGFRNGAGRPIGRPNVVTATLKRAIMLAAEDVGEDGNGKDGLQGYLKRLAINEPQAFTSLLRRILPVQVKADVDPRSTLGQVLEAVRSRVEMERAKIIDAKPRSTWTRD